MTKEEIRQALFELRDEEYRLFQAKLMPGIDVEKIIGVRTPVFRDFGKKLLKSGEFEEFLLECPHEYYDEMNLHAFLICEFKDYDRVVAELDRFLPFVDNWATCDLMSPKKAFSKNLDRLEVDCKRWMESEDTYVIRFGMEMLMTFYLDDAFDPKYLQWVAEVCSEEYYVNMMKAWYFATALAKQYEATIPFIEDRRLDEWTHKKAIQKARESYRITPEQKAYLKSLK